MEFYILNQNEEITATLSTDSAGEHTPVYSAIVDEKLGSYDTLELSIPSGVEHDLDIKEEYYIVFEDIKGFREYIINEVVDVDDGEISRTITAELSSIELLDEIIQTNLTGNNPTTILTNILKNTRWTIGNVDPSIYNSAFTEETEMVSVLEGIDLLSSSFNAEVSFSYAVAGNKITKRFVNLHKQMGANNGKRFEVDKDVTSIKRTIDTSSIKTAIIPFGAEPEEGKARLSIKDLVWSKAAGNPVDKPKGQEWIGDPTALAQWGKNNADGSRRHRFLAQEINVETAAELATMAWVHLGQYTKPKTTYEAVAMDLYTLTGDEDLKHEYVNLGDTVVITDFYFAQPLVVQTRVSELKRDLLEPLNNDLVFGDSLELFSTSRQADRLETIKKELSNRIELVRQSADGKSDTYLGSDEPISPNESDMWYRPHPTLPNETQFLIFNGLTWDIILDTSNLDSVGKEVIAIIEQADRDREKAEADFEAAKTAAKAYTDKKATEFDTKFNTETGAIREEITQGYTDALTDGKTYTDTKATEFNTKMEVVKTDVAATKIKADKAITDSETAIAEAAFAKVDATTAKQNAVTAISTAETAKTNAATALTNAGTAISTANTAKTNAGTALTTAQTSLTNSGTAIANAQTALNAYNNLEIGGRNLVLGTTIALEIIGNGLNNQSKYSYKFDGTRVAGRDVFVRYKWKVTGSSNPTGNFSLQTTGNNQWVQLNTINIASRTSGEETQSYTFSSNASFTDLGVRANYLNGTLVIYDVIIVIGNKVGDWSPAPEDVQVQITDINGELSRKVAQTTFDTLNGTVTNQGTQISQSQTAIGLKADKSVVDTINQTVSSHTLSIKATADELATKAEKSLVDSLNGTVATHTSQLKVNADGLALKADKTLVDTVKGTVDTHTSQIKATSDGLALKAEKSLVDSINGTVGTHTSQIKATSDGLALKAEKSLVDTVKGTVDTHTTQITATSNGLALKADSSLVNSINGTVSTHTNQISANSTAIAARLTSAQVDSLVAAKKYVNETTLNATANGLSTSITQVSTDINNLELGSRNLVRNGDFSNDIKHWNRSGGSSTVRNESYLPGFTKVMEITTTGANQHVNTQVPIVANRTYTLSMMAMNIGANNGNYVQIYYVDKTTGQGVWKDNAITDFGQSWNRKSLTFSYNTDSINIRVGKGGVATNPGKTIFTGVTLVEGNKSIDWTPAVEDMTTLEKFTTLEATVNGINTTVGTKANQSQVTQLATQVSSKVESATYSTKMTQLDSSINLRLESSKVISQINLSTEGILLQGKRIQLDGDVTMTTAFVDRLDVNALSAVYADIATLKTKVLTADVITSTHLKVDNAIVDKLTATTAIVDRFFSKTAVIDQVEAKSLSAVYADIATLKTKVLTADVITSTHLKSDTALITKLFATDANIGVLTSKTAFINSIKAVDISADKITAGVLNAANVNIINLNANKIATGTITGANSFWNLNTGVVSLRNPSNGDNLQLTQGEIQFQNGAQGRYLRYQSEGLRLIPFAGNTGTSKNTALHLIGGGSGSYQYIQFVSQETGGIDMRLQAVGQDMTAYHGSAGALIVAKYGESSNSGLVITGAYETRHSSGVSLRIAGDSISTPRDGSRNLYLVPQGTGSVVSGNASGLRYTMVASDFVKQSTRESKTDIKPIETKGLDVINRLTPVSYKKKDKVAQGIIETELGFIAEDSLEVATVDAQGIYDSHITAYLVKAVQELNTVVRSQDEKIKQLESGK